MKTDNGKATAFWLELVLSLTALAVCGCICLVLFVQADAASKRSRAETEALIRAQSAAEAFKAAAAAQLDRQGNSLLRVCYGPDWTPSSEADAAYCMETSYSEKDAVASAQITVRTQPGGEVICALTVKKYLPERRELP